MAQHRLHDSWTLWWDPRHLKKEPDSSEAYAQRLEPIHTFSTIEEFWRAWSWIKPPSNCPPNCNISIFRQGHKPMWENFQNGGMWIMKIKRNLTIDKRGGPRVPLADALWETIVLACVGETFGMPEVVGAVVSTRNKEIVLSIWNVDNDNPAVQFKIGQKLRDLCSLPPNFLMRYKNFERAMREGSSYRNAQTYIFPEDPLQVEPTSKESEAPEGTPLTVTVAE